MSRRKKPGEAGLGDLVDKKGACAILGVDRPISRATLDRGVASGRYPKPIHISPGRLRFVVAELLEAVAKAREER